VNNVPPEILNAMQRVPSGQEAIQMGENYPPRTMQGESQRRQVENNLRRAMKRQKGKQIRMLMQEGKMNEYDLMKLINSGEISLEDVLGDDHRISYGNKENSNAT